MASVAQPAIAQPAEPQLATLPPTAQEWKDVLAELLPPQGSWSEEEFLVLTGDRHRLVEYTDGLLEVIPVPTDQHQSILKYLFLAFFGYFESRGSEVHFNGLRLKIRAGKIREPDLLVLLSAKDPRRQNQFWLGADLVLEVVSEDKPERDLVEKRADYAEGKVPEYWIVNPMSETITVLALSGAAYQETGVYRRGESARSVLRPEFSVAVAEVFDAAQVK